MGYLFCEKCGGYYELKEGENIDDFKSCECGGSLRYVESLDELESSSDNIKINLKCPFCGSENATQNKFCDNCGKSLDGKIGLKNEDINLKNKDIKKPNYNKVARGFLIAVIIIAFISILPWLTGNITDITNSIYPNHYDNGIYSFDYPNTLKAENSTYNISYLQHREQNSGPICEALTHLSPIDNGNFVIHIDIVTKRLTFDWPINQPVENLAVINPNIDEGILFHSLPYTEKNQTNQNVVINTTESVLNDYKEKHGEAKKTTKNGYTYYELEPITYTGPWSSSVTYYTIIDKEDYPYLFLIEVWVMTSENKDTTQGYNAYKKITDTFKIE